MLRQVSSSRSQRSKGGFKLKNGIQMGLLVVISLWLLYQMKHSHDREQAYEERESTKVSSLVEIARLGRKALPHTTEINTEEEEKEDAKSVEREIRHGADEEEEKLHLISRVQESLEKGASHKEVTAEHDEGSHEAQERRFKGDDASSAVEHFTEVKEFKSSEGSSFKDVEHLTQHNESEFESETETKQNPDDRPNEYMARKDAEAKNMSGASSKGDSSVGAHASEESYSTVGKKEDESPPDRKLGSNAMTSEEKKAELAPRTPDEVRRSVKIKVGSFAHKAEANLDHKTEAIRNVERLAHSANSVDNRTGVATTNSTYRSEDKINFLTNSSALLPSQIESQKMVVDLAMNITHPQGHISQETPGKNDSSENSQSEKANVLEETGKITNLMETDETSKSPSETNENGRTVPLEISPSSLI